MMTGNATLECTVSAGISTFLSGHLSNLTGGDKKSSLAIMGDTVFSVGLTFGLGKIYGKPVEFSKRGLSKLFSNNSAIKRLSGSGSYEASYKMMITRLKNGSSNGFTWKTIRNGTVAQMTDSYLETLTNGYIDSFKELNQEKPHVKIDYSKFVNFQY